MEYIYSNNNSIIGSTKRSIKHKKNKSKKIIQNIVLMLAIFLIFSTFINVSLGKDKLTTKTIVVDSGSTLWNIANNICENNPELNVQNVIIQIKNLNNLKSSMIYEGQELKIYNY